MLSNTVIAPNKKQTCLLRGTSMLASKLKSQFVIADQLSILTDIRLQMMVKMRKLVKSLEDKIMKFYLLNILRSFDTYLIIYASLQGIFTKSIKLDQSNQQSISKKLN